MTSNKSSHLELKFAGISTCIALFFPGLLWGLFGGDGVFLGGHFCLSVFVVGGCCVLSSVCVTFPPQFGFLKLKEVVSYK